MSVELKEIGLTDIEKILKFSDKWIGTNYFTAKELEEIIKLGKTAQVNTSFKAESIDGKLAGIRLSLAPGEWVNSMRGLSTDLWNVDSSKVGYFKSLFISDEFQKQGIGKALSNLSIENLKKAGAKAIICHSWLESPSNSSQRYLLSMGFSAVKTHKEFWSEVDYHCIKCGPSKCLCTAVEMIKYI